MKLSEQLKQDGFSLSFEVFPPKTDTGFSSVKAATEKIAALGPAFVSVTYGAGGGTSRYTLDIADNIRRNYGVPAVAHLTCVSSTRETVAARIAELRARGIENVMALRGDLTPELAASDRSGWAYRHAVDLIRELRESGGEFCIGGACYPEVHPESANSREDLLHLREKQDAGCDFFTTQMVFDNTLFYSFLARARQAGITVPILPGVMPITNVTQIQRAVQLSGSFLPREFLAITDRFGDKPEAMKQAGLAFATEQIVDLFANGVRNVHVYTMNKPDVAAKLMENLSGILS